MALTARLFQLKKASIEKGNMRGHDEFTAPSILPFIRGIVAMLAADDFRQVGLV